MVSDDIRRLRERINVRSSRQSTFVVKPVESEELNVDVVEERLESIKKIEDSISIGEIEAYKVKVKQEVEDEDDYRGSTSNTSKLIVFFVVLLFPLLIFGIPFLIFGIPFLLDFADDSQEVDVTSEVISPSDTIDSTVSDMFNLIPVILSLSVGLFIILKFFSIF